ncbi:DUF1963 domain-containing protein [Prosthecobacter sp.]|uniref:DUF1963 domain-containing protein n=1 Tax=Prosthecobacter sp. TaxID=1965333 RepID=UPI003783D503
MSSLSVPLLELLKYALKTCEFSESDCEVIRKEAAECWYLQVIKDDCDTMGSSRMGGLPDLPQGMAWPQGRHGALLFVMQLRLDAAGGTLPYCMPDCGMLYFFVEDDELAKNVMHKLIWVEDISALQTAKQPPMPRMHGDDLVPHAIRIVHGVDVPIWDLFGLDCYERDDSSDLISRFESLLKGVSDPEGTAGKLFGYQSREKNGPLECMALLSLSSSDSKPLSAVGHDAWERLKATEEAYADSPDKIEEEMNRWCQLLHIDSNFQVGFNIWDAGSYQVMLRHSDLAKRDFAKSHALLETC